jgi:bacteriocin-type transport-associated protein
MTDVLLKELTNSDIDWMLKTGQRLEVQAGEVLLHDNQRSNALYILLEGTLAEFLPQVEDHPLSRAFAAIEGDEATLREITRLSSGAVVGDIPLLRNRPTATLVKVIAPSLMLTISLQLLEAKVKEDAGFAARFYHAIAILFADRLQNIIHQLGRSKLVPAHTLRDVLYVFSELNDSDLDWMIGVGQQQKISSGTVLIHQDAPVDALYILLNGKIAVSVAEDEQNPLTRAFTAILDDDISSGKEVDRLSRGEMMGETFFVDGRLPLATLTALEDTMILSVPRQQLAAKLQQDLGFAARFYRVVAMLLAERSQELLSRLGYGKRVYRRGLPLNDVTHYEDELDLKILDKVALAGARFDWMLKHSLH